MFRRLALRHAGYVVIALVASSSFYGGMQTVEDIAAWYRDKPIETEGVNKVDHSVKLYSCKILTIEGINTILCRSKDGEPLAFILESALADVIPPTPDQGL